MKAGVVRISYSAGKYTGEGMRGGTLHISGHIASLGRVKNGTIYEGGRQVFPPARGT
jgi:formylmethanofuran dehydrogenase subunit C